MEFHPVVDMPLDAIIIPNRKRKFAPDKATGLAGSMSQNGLINPITLNSNGVLLAGLHRIEAAKILEWQSIPAIILPDLDALQAELIEIDENFIRNELTYIEQGAHLNRRNEILEEMGLRAKRGGQNGNINAAKNEGELNSPSFFDEDDEPPAEPQPKTTEDIAAEVGLGKRSAKQRMQIDRNLSPAVKELIADTELAERLYELLALCRLDTDLQLEVAGLIVSGEADNVKAALKKIKQQQRQQEIEEQRQEIKSIAPPDNLFDIIVIDPPWPYGTKYDAQGRRAASPYPEMSLEEIKAIELPAGDNCVLWLWTTHKFMRHSFAILDHWQFRDVAILTWKKNRMGLGQWLRSQTEFCIMAIKGNPTVDLINQTTFLEGPIREHSRKPDEFYQMVESLCVGYKLDYFSRERREGWEQYGNNVAEFNHS